MLTCTHPICGCVKTESNGKKASCNKEARKHELTLIKEADKKTKLLEKQKEKVKKQAPIAKYSENNHYTCSDTGEIVSRAEAERRVRLTKATFLANFMNEHGYYFCEDCGTTCDYLDCSHNKSINECIQNGMIELSWWIGNFALRCRSKCHPKKDNSGLQWTSLKS